MVKAEIVDSEGKSYIVARTIESSKGEKRKLKTLDSTLTTISKDKKQVNNLLWNIYCLIL